MRRSLKSEQLQRLLAAHIQQLPLPESNPQCISNTLWSVATLKADVATDALEAIFDTFAARLQSAEPQALSNALWAASSLHPPFLPRQLLQDSAAVKFIVEVLLPSMKIQELSNVTVACGLLGWSDNLLLLPLVSRAAELAEQEKRQQQQQVVHQAAQQSTQQQQSAASAAGLPAPISSSSSSSGGGGSGSYSRHGSSSSAVSNTQAWCNICWAAAVLNLTELTPQLLRMAEQSAAAWGQLQEEDVVQLFQLHIWMTDSGGEGLAGILDEQQLQVCRAAWVRLLEQKARTSRLQVGVVEKDST
jgi:hypothetical protein